MSAQNCDGSDGKCRCRRTQKTLDDAKEKRVTATTSNDNDAAVGGGGGGVALQQPPTAAGMASKYPNDFVSIVHFDADLPGWVCSSSLCGHAIEVHPNDVLAPQQQQVPPPPMTLFPLTNEQKQYVGQRVWSIEVHGGLTGSACAVNYDGDPGFVTSRHLFTSNGQTNGRLLSKPFNATLSTSSRPTESITIEFFYEQDDVLFFKYKGSQYRTFEHVSIPPHTQLVYQATHVSREDVVGSCGDAIAIDDFSPGALHVSSGFANYETPSVVVSTAYAARGWSGGPVFTVTECGGIHNAAEKITLVGIVRPGSIADEDRRNGDVMPRVLVQLIPRELLTATSPDIAMYGALAVAPPFLRATLEYVSGLKLQPCRSLLAAAANIADELPSAAHHTFEVDRSPAVESATTSASTTNSPAANEPSAIVACDTSGERETAGDDGADVDILQ